MKQPKIRYFLEAKNKDNNKRLSKELVMAEVSYAYRTLDGKGNARIKPFRFSLQATILPSEFGLPETNFRLDKEVFKKHSKKNAYILGQMAQLENAVNDLAIYFSFNKIEPTPQEFKNELKIKLGHVKREVKMELSILQYLYNKIEQSRIDVNTSKKGAIKPNTIKIYVTVSHLLENFQIATGEVLRFKDFDKSKYEQLWDVLDDIVRDKIKVVNPNQPKKQKKQDYGYLATSIRKYQKNLLQTLKEASKDGLKVPLDVYDTDLIIKDNEASKRFYIEEDILKEVIKADLQNDKDLQLAKEYLIIACLTGMRYESMYDTKNAKIITHKEGNLQFDYINSIQNKTSTEVYIPLLQPVKDILEKRGKFPTFKSNGEMNELLKKLFSFLKINRMEDVVRATYKSGVIKTKEPLNKLISTHDCRGTFYSNLYKAGVSQTIIDKITHPDKPEKNAMAVKYNKVDMIVNAKFFVEAINKIKSDVYKF